MAAAASHTEKPLSRSFSRGNLRSCAPKESANGADGKLLANLPYQTVVDLAVTRSRCSCIVCWISIYRAATTSALQVSDRFMPLQTRGDPTWIESDKSSIESASAPASRLGMGNGLPSSRRHCARSSIALRPSGARPTNRNPVLRLQENRALPPSPSRQALEEGRRQYGTGAYAYLTATGINSLKTI
jgi:hypothetical protein